MAFVAEEETDAALSAMLSHPAGCDAKVIGLVTAARPGTVTMNTLFGGTRIVDMLIGEQLPRIC